MLHDWLELSLGDVITLQRGFDLPNRERIPGNVPVVSSSGISGIHSEAKVSAPGVVTGRYGTIGQVFYIKEDYWPLNTTLFVKDFKGNDPLFVSFLLRTIDFLSCSDKSSVPGLNRNDLHLIKVKLPPLSEQKAIAHILGTLDDKIELNREMNQTLEAMARAIFKSWFVDFDPVRAKMEGRQPAGMDAATAELFPDEFEESALGMIPKGWRVGTIDNCTSLIIDYRGKTPKKLQGNWSLSGIPAISAKNIKTGRLVQRESIRYVDPQLFKRWMKDTLSIRDIIMTSEAPLGELFYLARNANYCLSQRLFGIRADDINCKSIYLYHALATEEVQAQIQSRATGTTVLGIRQTELRKVQILLPLITIQEKASVHLENYMRQVHLNEEENETLASIRDTLLPKLLSGEIRIKEADKIAAKAM